MLVKELKEGYLKINADVNGSYNIMKKQSQMCNTQMG